MKKFNFEEFLIFIVLLGFSTLFYFLLFTGKINSFISPKMIKYIIFALVVFTILTFYQGNKIFIPKTVKPINKSFTILLLTIFIGFAAAEKGVNLSISNNKSVNLPSYVKSDKISSSPLEKNNKPTEDKLKETLFLTDGNNIVIEDNNFYKAVNDIGMNIEKYRGKKVILSGFVFKREDFKPDQFVVGRMSMACCAADAQVMGLMSKWAETPNLEKDTWVKVEGIIGSTEQKNVESEGTLILPLVEIVNIEKIETPENIYVYPQN